MRGWLGEIGEGAETSGQLGERASDEKKKRVGGWKRRVRYGTGW